MLLTSSSLSRHSTSLSLLSIECKTISDSALCDDCRGVETDGVVSSGGWVAALGGSREGVGAGFAGETVAVSGLGGSREGVVSRFAGLSVVVNLVPTDVLTAGVKGSGLGSEREGSVAGVAGMVCCVASTAGPSRRARFTLVRTDILPAVATCRRLSCFELTRAPLSVIKQKLALPSTEPGGS